MFKDVNLQLNLGFRSETFVYTGVGFYLNSVFTKNVCTLIFSLPSEETSLLRRLQAQTLPNAASPIGKVHPFSKIAVTLEPVMRF